jgi:hypothetical protein
LPLAPLMGQVFVTHVWAPPVLETAQVPTSVPVWLSSRTSMFPPLPADATLTSSEVAPEAKSTPLILMKSPFSMAVTSMPPSLHVSVLTSHAQEMVSASV